MEEGGEVLSVGAQGLFWEAACPRHNVTEARGQLGVRLPPAASPVGRGAIATMHCGPYKARTSAVSSMVSFYPSADRFLPAHSRAGCTPG